MMVRGTIRIEVAGVGVEDVDGPRFGRTVSLYLESYPDGEEGVEEVG